MSYFRIDKSWWAMPQWAKPMWFHVLVKRSRPVEPSRKRRRQALNGLSHAIQVITGPLNLNLVQLHLWGECWGI